MRSSSLDPTEKLYRAFKVRTRNKSTWTFLTGFGMIWFFRTLDTDIKRKQKLFLNKIKSQMYAVYIVSEKLMTKWVTVLITL